MADPHCAPDRLAEIGRAVTRRLNVHPDVQHIDAAGAQLYVLQQFLSPDECSALMAIMDKESVPSTLYEEGWIEGYRTSYSCHMDGSDAVVAAVEARLAALTGLDNSHAETMQGQRYQVGQEYRQHHDFFHTGQKYWQRERTQGGQRSWTAMIYLNEPEVGGETEFCTLQIAVQPRAGMLVLWNNMRPDGTPNERTLHWGRPVTAGTKYIVTKWYRLDRWTPLAGGQKS